MLANTLLTIMTFIIQGESCIKEKEKGGSFDARYLDISALFFTP